METAELLTNARAEMEARGMIKGSFYKMPKEDFPGAVSGVCAVGAVRLAAAYSVGEEYQTMNPTANASIGLACGILNECIPHRIAQRHWQSKGKPMTIVEYNDRCRTTQRQMLRLFDRAIRLAAERAPAAPPTPPIPQYPAVLNVIIAPAPALEEQPAAALTHPA